MACCAAPAETQTRRNYRFFSIDPTLNRIVAFKTSERLNNVYTTYLILREGTLTDGEQARLN